MRAYVQIAVLLLVLNINAISCVDYPEASLIDKLLAGYSHRTRPVKNPDDVVNVNMTFHLTKVVSLDADTQILTTSGWLQVVWNDPRMTWDPAQYGNIKRTSLFPSDVWFPDFALENSAGNMYELAHSRSFKITVDHDGRMEWEPGGLYMTYCLVEVLYYPFDTQKCDIKFSEWGYDSTQVVLEVGIDGIFADEGYYQSGGAWKIKTTSARSEVHQYEARESFSRIIFSVTLNRIYIYYFMTLLFPALVLSGLVLLVYAVPRDLSEKLSMGLTLMLSYFVFMLNVNDNVPRSTQVIPIIQIYLLFYMGITAITIGLSVMMLWLNHTKHVDRPPYWLRFIVYRIMANAICYYGLCSGKDRFTYWGKDEENSKKKGTSNGKAEKSATRQGASNLVELAKVSSAAESIEEGLARENPSMAHGLLESIAQIKSKLATIEKGTRDMMNYIWKYGEESETTPEEVERIKREWVELTIIINRFSFWVLFSFTVVFIILCIILWVTRS